MAEEPIPAPPVPAAASRQAPSFAAAAMRVFELSLGQMLWSRRTVFLALVVGAPVVLGIIIRLLAAYAGRGGLHMSGAPIVAGPSIFGLFIWVLYLRFIVPVLGVFYGTALIADEVDDKTITYLFTRPISRGAIVFGKFLAYLVATALVVLPSVMLLFFLVVPTNGGSLAGSFPALLTDLALLGLGLACYGALFAWVGAQFKHPLVMGLVFAFGWEQAILLVPGYLKRFTIAYYIQGLVPHAMPRDSALSFLQAVVSGSLSAPESLAWLLAILVVFLTLAARAVTRREYVLEQ